MGEHLRIREKPLWYILWSTNLFSLIWKVHIKENAHKIFHSPKEMEHNFPLAELSAVVTVCDVADMSLHDQAIKSPWLPSKRLSLVSLYGIVEFPSAKTFWHVDPGIELRFLSLAENVFHLLSHLTSPESSIFFLRNIDLILPVEESLFPQIFHYLVLMTHPSYLVYDSDMQANQRIWLFLFKRKKKWDKDSCSSG